MEQLPQGLPPKDQKEQIRQDEAVKEEKQPETIRKQSESTTKNVDYQQTTLNKEYTPYSLVQGGIRAMLVTFREAGNAIANAAEGVRRFLSGEKGESAPTTSFKGGVQQEGPYASLSLDHKIKDLTKEITPLSIERNNYQSIVESHDKELMEMRESLAEMKRELENPKRPPNLSEKAFTRYETDRKEGLLDLIERKTFEIEIYERLKNRHAAKVQELDQKIQPLQEELTTLRGPPRDFRTVAREIKTAIGDRFTEFTRYAGLSKRPETANDINLERTKVKQKELELQLLSLGPAKYQKGQNIKKLEKEVEELKKNNNIYKFEKEIAERREIISKAEKRPDSEEYVAQLRSEIEYRENVLNEVQTKERIIEQDTMDFYDLEIAIDRCLDNIAHTKEELTYYQGIQEKQNPSLKDDFSKFADTLAGRISAMGRGIVEAGQRIGVATGMIAPHVESPFYKMFEDLKASNSPIQILALCNELQSDAMKDRLTESGGSALVEEKKTNAERLLGISEDTDEMERKPVDIQVFIASLALGLNPNETLESRLQGDALLGGLAWFETDPQKHPVEMPTGEIKQIAVKIPTGAFKAIDSILKDPAFPIEGKMRLVPLVSDWAQSTNHPSLTRNAEMLKQAENIAITAYGLDNPSLSQSGYALLNLLHGEHGLVAASRQPSAFPELPVWSVAKPFEEECARVRNNFNAEDVDLMAEAFHKSTLHMWANYDIADMVPGKPGPTDMKLGSFSNANAFMIIESILVKGYLQDEDGKKNPELSTQEEVVKMINFFTEVGKKAAERGDLSTVLTIAVALNNSIIRRIINRKDLFPQSLKDDLANLEQLTSMMSANKATRANYAKAHQKFLKKGGLPPTIPPSVFTTDLTFVEEGNPDFKENKLNLEKIQMRNSNLNKMQKLVAESRSAELVSPISFPKISYQSTENDYYQYSLNLFPKASV